MLCEVFSAPAFALSAALFGFSMNRMRNMGWKIDSKVSLGS